MTPRQTELAKRICTPTQRKVMVMREKYAVEEVAKSLDIAAAEIDQIEAEGWLRLGSYRLTIRAARDTLNLMRARNIHPDATT
jgi:transcriptional regulator